MFFQMVGTLLPLTLLFEIVYGSFTFSLTLEGQYIAENIVLIATVIVVGSHIRDKH
ncbi:hypothetical protein HY500_03415 [Candidatus Woesearchaeota archaeon]|nr:hypothetical protein [Candidatus Woesearchaeota archaeon]